MSDIIEVSGLSDIEVENTAVDDLNFEVVDLNFVAIDQSGSMSCFVQIMKQALSVFKTALVESKESEKMLIARADFYMRNINIGGYKKIEEFDEKTYSAMGGTPMYDTIVEGADKLLKYMEFLSDTGYKPRAVFSVFSDGEDTSSYNNMNTARSIINDLNSKEITTSFIAFGDGAETEAKNLNFQNILKIKQTGNQALDASELREAFNRFSTSIIEKSKSVVNNTQDFFKI